MPVPRDSTMLKPDSRKVLIAMAEAEMEPAELAVAAGIPKNIVYTIRRGFYTKPKYIGAVARAMQVKVTDLIEDEKKAAEEVETDGSQGRTDSECICKTPACAAEP